jgi:hypothetical protein
MTLIRLTAAACFVLAALAFVLAMVAEFPPVLAAVPALALAGVGQLGLNRVIELLTEIKNEISEERYGIKKV